MASLVTTTKPLSTQDDSNEFSTRVAAADFFAGYQRGAWQTLPQRVQKLCHFLHHSRDDTLPFTFSQDPLQARCIAVTARIMVLCPAGFLVDFESLMRASLTYQLEQQQDEDEEKLLTEPPIANPVEFFHNLNMLGWILPGAWLERAFCQAVRHCICQLVKKQIESDYETPNLLDTTILPHIEGCIAEWVLSHVFGKQQQDKVCAEWISDLKLAAARSFCQVRLDEIFDIVADYPDSLPACQELQRFLRAKQIPELHHALGQTLRGALVRRLNHPGAKTSQIIDVYINTIQVLRLLDPTDRLLRIVTEPVRAYLRERPDTVRCIITSLTDPNNGDSDDLYQELRRQDAKPLEHVAVLVGDGGTTEEDINDHEDQEGPPTLDWQPPPSIFQPKGTFLSSTGAASSWESSGDTGETPATHANNDLLAMLVSIYGSKDLFVNEYRLMLADKLLANLDYNTDREVHTLELLKLRFGEVSMRNCEVMVKDMDDSKRTNALIREELRSVPTRSGLSADNQPVVDASVVSHIFWPTLQQEPLKHHPRIQADIDEFSSVYGRLKNPRKLIWMNQLGSVEVELDVTDEGPDGAPAVQTRSFTCTPLQATLIMHFQDKSSWTAEDLANEVGVPAHEIQKRISYWVHQRVIRLRTDETDNSFYELVSAAFPDGEIPESGMLLDDDEVMDVSQQAVSVSAHHEEEMQIYENYVVGMLTNMGQLPLERIHSMLKMFVAGSDRRYDKTPQQLSLFLQQLVKQEKLECGPDGMYRLFGK